MDAKQFKSKLSMLKGVNWCIEWGTSEYHTGVDCIYFYIKDWNGDTEESIFLKKVILEKDKSDFEDEFKEILDIIKSKEYEIDSFRVYSLKNAMDEWGIETSTLRKFLPRGIAIEGVDYLKVDKVWFVAKDSKDFFLQNISIRSKKRT